MLSKNTKIASIIILVCIGVLSFLETTEQTDLNWFPSYTKTDKIPLGTFVSYSLLTEVFQDRLTDINQPPFEYLMVDKGEEKTYLFINQNISFDEKELDKVLYWVDQGNTLFISAKTIGETLLDTLGIKTKNLVLSADVSSEPILALTNRNLKDSLPYRYPRSISNPYFAEIDTVNAEALGVMQLYKDTLKIDKSKINYLSQPFGKGKVLLHLFPEAFTNYFMLTENNYQYTEGVLAYINKDNPVLWDNYYKNGKTFYTSPLFFLLSNRYLKWSYYVLLIGLVLFVIFEGKRKQRSIPVIKPLKNQTLAFTRTISGLYFEKQQHTEITRKQYRLLLDYVRSTLRISTEHIDREIINSIAIKNNSDPEKTKKLFQFAADLNTRNSVKTSELIKLNALITDFKNPVERKNGIN